MENRVLAEVDVSGAVVSPDGTVYSACAVTCGEELTLFGGPDAISRATEYARQRYGKVNFRMQAEPGQIGLRGTSVN